MLYRECWRKEEGVGIGKDKKIKMQRKMLDLWSSTNLNARTSHATQTPLVMPHHMPQGHLTCQLSTLSF